LPLLPVSTQALTAFGIAIDRQLEAFVKHFGGRDREVTINARSNWQSPRPSNPR